MSKSIPDPDGGQYNPVNPSYNSGYEDGRNAAKARIQDLERELAAEKERADFGWRNVKILEAARVEQDEIIASLKFETSQR